LDLFIYLLSIDFVDNRMFIAFWDLSLIMISGAYFLVCFSDYWSVGNDGTNGRTVLTPQTISISHETSRWRSFASLLEI